jgi:hypothetical protein
MAVQLAVGRPEVEKKASLLSPNLWLSRLSPREIQTINLYNIKSILLHTYEIYFHIYLYRIIIVDFFLQIF